MALAWGLNFRTKSLALAIIKFIRWDKLVFEDRKIGQILSVYFRSFQAL